MSLLLGGFLCYNQNIKAFEGNDIYEETDFLASLYNNVAELSSFRKRFRYG
jgi:hypothetical protein